MPPNISSTPRFFALIPCAGLGTRAGSSLPKQYQMIAGLPMVVHTMRAFMGVPRICNGVLVLSSSDPYMLDIEKSYPQNLFKSAHVGGVTRAASVIAGLKMLSQSGAGSEDWVLVHDAARCLVTSNLIDALIDACIDDPVGGLLAHKLADTLKVESQGRVEQTIDRSHKYLAQTPQMFRLGQLEKALQMAGDGVTDESSAIELVGMSPKIVQSHLQNFKVTYPEDFSLAESILNSRLKGNA